MKHGFEMNAGGGRTAQVGIGLGHHVKQFGQDLGRKVEAALNEVLVNVFDHLIAFEVVSVHQPIKMPHRPVKHAGVPRALLFPAPIVQAATQGLLNDHPHFDNFRFLKQAAKRVAIGVQASADQQFGDEQRSTEVPIHDVGDVLEHRGIRGPCLGTGMLQPRHDLFAAHGWHADVLDTAPDGVDEAGWCSGGEQEAGATASRFHHATEVGLPLWSKMVGVFDDNEPGDRLTSVTPNRFLTGRRCVVIALIE